MECPVVGGRYREIVEIKRIFKFLSALNSSLDDVWGHILGAKPLPRLRGVLSHERHEESCQKIMLGPSTLSLSVDASVLVAQHHSSPRGDKSGGVHHSQPSPKTGQF